ncbi:MAG: thioredoxin [Myxococcota bacterium]|jgi:thioredoxin 1|nr:thioredoxin [Myxococcota bacterium]
MGFKIKKKRTAPAGNTPLVVEEGVPNVGTDANFKALVLEAKVPVLVDFWAEWCGPCRRVGPVVERIAESNAGKARVVKVNVDHNRAVASRYEIRSIPSLLVFKGGEVVETMVGLQSKENLQRALDRHL